MRVVVGVFVFVVAVSLVGLSYAEAKDMFRLEGGGAKVNAIESLEGELIKYSQVREILVNNEPVLLGSHQDGQNTEAGVGSFGVEISNSIWSQMERLQAIRSKRQAL